MRFNYYLNDILGNKLKIDVLRFLSKHMNEFSGREIGKATHYSHVNCHKALKELSKSGIITFKKTGKSLLYTINRNHYLFTEILIPLFKKEHKIFEDLASTIIRGLKKIKPTSIILFGSVAKGTESTGSDIDLLVICETSSHKNKIDDALLTLDSVICIKFGNQISPIVLTQKEFKSKYRQKESLIMNIEKDCKVIYGKFISELIW